MAFLCQLYIAFGGFLGFLLECVKHIHGIGYFGGIDNAVYAYLVFQADFYYTASNGGHGFKIGGHFSALDFMQLITCLLFGIGGKTSKPV